MGNSVNAMGTHHQQQPMVNNFGSIINNNYLLKKLSTPRRDRTDRKKTECGLIGGSQDSGRGTDSPLIPPLVESCAGPGCHNVKQPEGGNLLMCGRCYSVKYFSKDCQLKHIKEHQLVCRKPETTPKAPKRTMIKS